MALHKSLFALAAVLVIGVACLAAGPTLPAAECGNDQAQPSGDRLSLTYNEYDDRAVAIVDGQRADGTCVSDMALSGVSTLTVGRLQPSSMCGVANLIVLGPEQRLQWLDASRCWTAGDSDQVELKMDTHPIEMPIKVWNLSEDGPTDADILKTATDYVQRANQIFSTAGAGIVLPRPQQIFRPSVPIATADCKTLGQIRTNDVLNLFFVWSLPIEDDQDLARGFSCNDDKSIVGINSNADGETLAHELGHALGLDHFYADLANVMVPSVGGRRMLTEGQAFRANVRPESLVNTIAGKGRRDGPTWRCPDGPTPECPNIVCTGCPYEPWQNIPPTHDRESLQQLMAEWFNCEECNEGEFDRVRRLSEAIDLAIASVSASFGKRALENVRMRARIAVRQIGTYEADDRHWRSGRNEDDYVRREEENYIASRQLRSTQILGALKSVMSAEQTTQARAALTAASSATRRTDVRLAIGRTMLVFSQP